MAPRINVLDTAGRWSYGVWCSPHDMHPDECWHLHYPEQELDDEYNKIRSRGGLVHDGSDDLPEV